MNQHYQPYAYLIEGIDPNALQSESPAFQHQLDIGLQRLSSDRECALDLGGFTAWLKRCDSLQLRPRILLSAYDSHLARMVRELQALPGARQVNSWEWLVWPPEPEALTRIIRDPDDEVIQALLLAWSDGTLESGAVGHARAQAPQGQAVWVDPLLNRLTLWLQHYAPGLEEQLGVRIAEVDGQRRLPGGLLNWMYTAGRAAPSSGLIDVIDKERKRIEPEARRLVGQLADIASRHRMPGLEQELHRQIGRLDAEQFEILVAGRFKVGKSTFLNALLSSTAPITGLQPDKGPLPVDTLPCTAVLSRISYSPTPFVKAQYFDGREEEWSFQRYTNEAQIWGEAATAEEPNPVMVDVKSFDIGLPVELLRGGMTVIDSPGISEDPRRTAITRDALRDAHAGVIMFRSDALAGSDEIEFASEVLDQTGHAFTVVNMFNDELADDRFRKVATSRVRRLTDVSGASKLEPDIYYIHCLRAFNGYRQAKLELVEKSRIQEFERRLGQFLLEGAYRARITAVVDCVDKLAGTEDTFLSDLKTVLRSDEAKVRKVLQQCAEDLAEIDKRQRRIETILGRIQQRAVEATSVSYLRMTMRLTDDIPSLFAEQPLPALRSWGGKVGSLITNKASKEAAEVLSTIIKRYIRNWCEKEPPAQGLQRDILEVIEDGREDLRTEYQGIEERLHAMQLRIHALDPHAEAPEGMVSLQDRLLGTGMGIALLGPLGLTAALGGWRGTVGGVLGALGAKVGMSLLASALGVAFAPVAVAAIIVGSILGGAVAGGVFDLEGRVRSKALEAVKPTLQKLRQDGAVVDQLSRQIHDALQRDGDRVLEALEKILRMEREKLRSLEEVNDNQLKDKSAQIKVIDTDLETIRISRGDLGQLAADAGTTATA